MQFLSYSHEQTEHIARRIAQEFRYTSPIVLLSWDLGAGKTTFVKWVLAAYGIRKGVTSPSFLLHKRYETPRGLVDHLDLYRSPSADDIIAKVDLPDLFATPSLKLIEWPEKLPLFFLETLDLSGPVWHVSICEVANNGRRFCITRDPRFTSEKPQPISEENVQNLWTPTQIHCGAKSITITTEETSVTLTSTPEHRQAVFALCMQTPHSHPIPLTQADVSFAEQRWLSILTGFGILVPHNQHDTDK